MTQQDFNASEGDRAISGLDRTLEGVGTTLGENADAAQSGMERGGDWAAEQAEKASKEAPGMAEGEQAAQEDIQESFEQSG